MHYNGLLVVTCLDYWVASCMVYFRLTRRSQPSVEAGGDERVACCLIVWGVSCGCKYIGGTQSVLTFIIVPREILRFPFVPPLYSQTFKEVNYCFLPWGWLGWRGGHWLIVSSTSALLCHLTQLSFHRKFASRINHQEYPDFRLHQRLRPWSLPDFTKPFYFNLNFSLKDPDVTGIQTVSFLPGVVSVLDISDGGVQSWAPASWSWLGNKETFPNTSRSPHRHWQSRRGGGSSKPFIWNMLICSSGSS